MTEPKEGYNSGVSRTVTGGVRIDGSFEEGQALDILTYDNQSIVGSVISNSNIASVAIPAGCKKALVEYMNHAAPGADEVCFIRWNGVANQVSCMRLRDGDSYILAVPETGDRRLNIIGQTGVTAGTFIRITPLG